MGGGFARPPFFLTGSNCGGIDVKWKASPTAVFTDLDGMTALLDTSNNVYFCLSGIGPYIWDNLQAGASIEQLRDAVTGTYDVAPDIAQHDISGLVDRLSAAGLVVAVDAD